MHGESIGLADDAIVCYVELSGELMPQSFTPHPSSVGILFIDALAVTAAISGSRAGMRPAAVQA